MEHEYFSSCQFLEYFNISQFLEYFNISQFLETVSQNLHFTFHLLLKLSQYQSQCHSPQSINKDDAIFFSSDCIHRQKDFIPLTQLSRLVGHENPQLFTNIIIHHHNYSPQLFSEHISLTSGSSQCTNVQRCPTPSPSPYR